MKKMNFYFNEGKNRLALTLSFFFLCAMSLMAQPFTLTGSVATRAVAAPTCGTTNVLDVTLTSTNAQGAFTVDVFLVNNTTNVTVPGTTVFDNILPKTLPVTAPAQAAGTSQTYRIEYRIWDAVNNVYLTPRVVLGNATIVAGPLPGRAATASANPPASDVNVATCNVTLPAAGSAANTFTLTDADACYTLANNGTAAAQGGLNVAVTNVNAQQLRIVASGTVPAGTYPITVNYTSNGAAQVANFTITVNSQTALVCAGQVNVTLPTSCNYTLTSQSVVQSCANPTDLVVEVQRNGIWGSAALTGADAGNTLPYRVRNTATNGMCWGNVLVEDKTAPICTAAPGNAPGTLTGYTGGNPYVLLACANAASATNLCVTGQFAAATNAASCSTAGPNGTASDCSAYEQRYTDVVTEFACTGQTVDGVTLVTRRIVRTWTLKDKWGNTSTGCSQNIYIRTQAYVPGDFNANNLNLSCTTAFTLNTPSLFRPIFTVGGAAVPTAASASLCEPYAVLKNEMEQPTCGGGRTIMRTWDIYRKCDNSLITTLVQTIILRDQAVPTATITPDNYSLVNAETYCFTMLNPNMLNPNQICKRRVLTATARPFGDATTGGGAINIVGVADQSVCLMSRVRFSLSNINYTDCPGFTSPDRVTVSDSRLVRTGNTFEGVFMFAAANQVQSFTVTITDDCGNAVTQTINVSYEDNAAPSPLADDVVTQIPNGACSVRITAAAVNERSFDNCGIKRIMIRKMPLAGSSGNPDDCWYDELTYTTADACLTGHMVLMRVVDFNDNCSEVMVPVRIDFKPSVACSNLPDVTRTCTSNDLLNWRQLFGDPATTGVGSHPAACLSTTVVDDNLASLSLNIGCTSTEVIRRWKIRANYCSNQSVTSTECTQKLIVTPVRGFRLTTQGDSTYACMAPTAAGVVGSSQWIENEKDKTINALNLLDCAGNKTCAAPVVEVEVWEFRSSQYCKIFRVRYTIVDQCVTPFPYYEAPIWGRNPSTACANLTARQAVIQDRGDAIVYERLIYIDDNTAPTSTPPTIADICDGSAADTDANTCEVGFTTTLTGSDNCGGTTATSNPGVLYYMWSLQRSSSATGPWTEVGTGTTPTVSRNDLPLNVFYRIVYRITDLCGNMSQEYTVGPFRTKDCKAPEIRVHDKIVALAGQQGVPSTGMGRIEYADIRNWIVDECDATLNVNTNKIYMERTTAALSATPQASGPVGFTGTYNGGTGIMFTCADIPAGANFANITIRVWTNDASGNWNYAVSTITVQDNDRICADRVGQIATATANEVGTAVDNVNVTARVNGSVVSAGATNTNGTFALTVPTRGSNVQVTAAKSSEVDAREGVSTADIAAISRHILGSQNLSSAYSIIAADVDKNGSVEASDMLQIRRFVLFISPALPAGSFRFVDKAYTFRNAAEPLGEDFPEVINVANIQGTDVAANFVAVKLGDVNNSYRHVSVRGSRSLMLTANDMDVIAGNEYTVNVNAANFDAAAFQGTFSFNGLTVKGIKAGSLSNMSDANFGQFNDAVTASWNGKSAGAADVVAITFVANKSGKLSEMMSFGSAKTAAEAIASNGEVLNVSLKFNTGKVSGSEFALYQNTPNPVATSTKVGFNLPKDGAARFTVFNAEGKVLFAKNGDYKAGYNEVVLNKSELAAGVLYYRLETADHSATKKMIIIE